MRIEGREGILEGILDMARVEKEFWKEGR